MDTLDEPETATSYHDVGESFGYEYLGGRCDVTELLEILGGLQIDVGLATTGRYLAMRLAAAGGSQILPAAPKRRRSFFAKVLRFCELG